MANFLLFFPFILWGCPVLSNVSVVPYFMYLLIIVLKGVWCFFHYLWKCFCNLLPRSHTCFVSSFVSHWMLSRRFKGKSKGKSNRSSCTLFEVNESLTECRCMKISMWHQFECEKVWLILNIHTKYSKYHVFTCDSSQILSWEAGCWSNKTQSIRKYLCKMLKIYSISFVYLEAKEYASRLLW